MRTVTDDLALGLRSSQTSLTHSDARVKGLRLFTVRHRVLPYDQRGQSNSRPSKCSTLSSTDEKSKPTASATPPSPIGVIVRFGV